MSSSELLVGILGTTSQSQKANEGGDRCSSAEIHPDTIGLAINFGCEISDPAGSPGSRIERPTHLHAEARRESLLVGVAERFEVAPARSVSTETRTTLGDSTFSSGPWPQPTKKRTMAAWRAGASMPSLQRMASLARGAPVSCRSPASRGSAASRRPDRRDAPSCPRTPAPAPRSGSARTSPRSSSPPPDPRSS